MKKWAKISLILILVISILYWSIDGLIGVYLQKKEDKETIENCKDSQQVLFKDSRIYICINSNKTYDFKLFHIRNNNIIDTIPIIDRTDNFYGIEQFDLRTDDILQVNFGNNKEINIYGFKNEINYEYRMPVKIVKCYFSSYKINNKEYMMEDSKLWLNKDILPG